MPVLESLRALLRQNATPAGLALSLTAGAVVGMTPGQAPRALKVLLCGRGGQATVAVVGL